MPHVGFRCSEHEKMVLEEISGGNTSAYLRRLAFGGDQGNDAMAHRLEDLAEDLRDAISSVRDSGSGGSAEGAAGLSAQWQAVILEMLMMMRGQFKPEAKRSAMAEVERVGLTPFDFNIYLENQGSNDD